MIPNSLGQIRYVAGRDKFARPTYSEPVDCPFSPVNLEIGAQKTSVRADSTASRGTAEETVAQRGRILIAPFVPPQIGCLFGFDGVNYRIVSVFARRSVLGHVDHYQCDLEIEPAQVMP